MLVFPEVHQGELAGLFFTSQFILQDSSLFLFGNMPSISVPFLVLFPNCWVSHLTPIFLPLPSIPILLCNEGERRKKTGLSRGKKRKVKVRKGKREEWVEGREGERERMRCSNDSREESTRSEGEAEEKSWKENRWGVRRKK